MRVMDDRSTHTSSGTETGTEAASGVSLGATIGSEKTAAQNEKAVAKPKGKAAKATQATNTAKVRVRWPVDELNTGLPGVPVLTQEPQEIPASKVKAVRDAAASAGTEIEVVE